MTFFTSEHESKLDAKGRLVLPARIKAQLPDGEQELVIRKGFEQCLILYPTVEFKKVFSKISSLNEFNEEYRKLQRNFLSGVVTVELDTNGRFLLPKNMLAYAQLDKDVTLVGTGNNGVYVTPANAPRAPVDRVYVSLADGADAAAVAAGLRKAVGAAGGQVFTKDQWVAASHPETNRTTRYGFFLVLGIALLYTGISLANTLGFDGQQLLPKKASGIARSVAGQCPTDRLVAHSITP